MKQEAIQYFLMGFNVIVTADDQQYAHVIQNSVWRMIRRIPVDSCTAIRSKISHDGNDMLFLPHGMAVDHPLVNPMRMYLLCEDHFDSKKMITLKRPLDIPVDMMYCNSTSSGIHPKYEPYYRRKLR